MNKILLLLLTIIGTAHDTLLPISSHLADTLHQNWWAHYQLNCGNLNTAHRFFGNLLDQKPLYHNFTLHGHIEFLFTTAKYKEIIKLYETHKHIFDTHKELKKIYALSLGKTNHNTQADLVFIALNKQFPTDVEISFYAVSGYMNRNELQNALHVVDSILSHKSGHQNDYIFYFLKAQICVKQGDMATAKIAAQKAVTLYPEFDKGWLLLSVLAEQDQQWEKAMHGYAMFLSLNKDTQHQEIQRHLLELALAQQKNSHSSYSFNHTKDTFNQAVHLFKQKNYKQALLHVEQCLGDDQNNKSYALLKLEILMHTNHYLQAIEYIEELIHANPTTSNYWFKVVHLLTCRKKEFVPFAIDMLGKKEYATNLPALLYLADIFLRECTWAQAEKTLNLLLPLITERTLTVEAKHQLAITYFMQQKNDLLFTTLQGVIMVDSQHIPSLNLLAHFYIMQKDFAKAEYEIAKARAIDTQNPYLIDTHGLVLYKQKKYKDAQKLFETALSKNANDASVLLHLAQTAYRQQQFAAAQSYLEQALTHASNEYERTKTTTFAKKRFPRH